MTKEQFNEYIKSLDDEAILEALEVVSNEVGYRNSLRTTVKDASEEAMFNAFKDLMRDLSKSDIHIKRR